MAYFQNDDLEYVVNDYYGDVVEFEEDNDAFADNQPRRSLEVVDSDSDSDDDFEDDLDSSKVKSDTSALEARNGKDIQGIPWESLISPEISTVRSDCSSIRTMRASVGLIKTSRRSASKWRRGRVSVTFTTTQGM